MAKQQDLYVGELCHCGKPAFYHAEVENGKIIRGLCKACDTAGCDDYPGQCLANSGTGETLLGYPVVTRTVLVNGVELPWVYKNPYPGGDPSHDSNGTVFVPIDVLRDIGENTWEYPNSTVSFHIGLALEAAELVVCDNRGNCYPTEKLRAFLKEATSF